MPVLPLPRQLAALFVSLLCFGRGLVAEPSGPTIVSSAQPVDLDQYIGSGKTLVVGFFSKFSPGCPCGPCTALPNPLGALQAARDDVQVLLIDIDREGSTQIDWNSPVALQFGVRRLPFFLVLGPNGRLRYADDAQGRTDDATEWVHHMIETLPMPAMVAAGH